ncbi:MAG: hypothetical protein KIG42_05085 [Paludibacteraceae bacterium]|nr:hypothetical protein [Paludibacteraceae bacterium]
MPSSNNSRFRFFDLLLYPDCEQHNEVLSVIKDSGIDFCGILHDKDVDETGNIKKAHIHLVLWGVQTTISSLSSRLGLPENYISIRGTRVSRLRYLVHADNPEKYQYSPDVAFGSPSGLKKFRESLNVSEDENDNVFSIISLLESYPQNEYVSLLTFVKDVCSSSLFPYYRRAQATFIELWRERNNFIMKGKN